MGLTLVWGWPKFVLSDKDISTCLVVMNVVVIGVVVLGMELGCEVKLEVGEKL